MMSHTRKRGSIAKVTYFPEGCIGWMVSMHGIRALLNNPAYVRILSEKISARE